MPQTFYYKLMERLEWTLLALGAGIFLLVLGVAFPILIPQERPAVAVSWLEVLTGRATGQPTFFTSLTQVIFVVFGILSLIYAVLIYRAVSVNISIDNDAIIYQKGKKIVRVPWSEVADIKKRVIASRFGAGEIVTLFAKTDSDKISFNSTIKGYPTLLEAIKTHTNIQFEA
ncbi:MAG: hypothetical protein ACFFCD_11890 [Promethearchaeota archaeon]